MTDPGSLDTRRDSLADHSPTARRRARYLPSEQVVKELVSLGPDLGKLADELRSRLSDPPGEARTELGGSLQADPRCEVLAVVARVAEK